MRSYLFFLVEIPHLTSSEHVTLVRWYKRTRSINFRCGYELAELERLYDGHDEPAPAKIDDTQEKDVRLEGRWPTAARQEGAPICSDLYLAHLLIVSCAARAKVQYLKTQALTYNSESYVNVTPLS